MISLDTAGELRKHRIIIIYLDSRISTELKTLGNLSDLES